MSWAWNLQDGWLRGLGFFDRGGTTIIYHSAALAGTVGAIVAGPRYGRFPKKSEIPKLKAANVESRPLPA